MDLKSKIKKKIGLAASILLHLLLLAGTIRTLDQDRYRPTSTKGYQVELMHIEDNSPAAATITPNIIKMNATDTSTAKVKSADINLKTDIKKSATTVIKHSAKKHPTKQEITKPVLSITKTMNDTVIPKPTASSVNSVAPATTPKEPNQQGVAMTNKNQEQIIASAPTGSPNTVGQGDNINSSTDGNGTQNGTFDFRVIEYGRDAADVIKQNIVIPNGYQYTHVTYRAFVILDKNMQFQSMQLVKSTGISEYDANIAKALQQTVYPPLPSGADWQQFHNIDFTIK